MSVFGQVNGAWALPPVVCDFYIAMDVTCSTSSIFNLVAISIDRYIAVTQPIKYAKHKNSRRVCLTIALVWVISAAIGSPIVLGLNNTPDRQPALCVFYNTDFILYSSLSSFYIPCIIMVFLYYNIFKALRNRARKAKAARKTNPSDIKPGSVIENIAQTRRLAETTLGPSLLPPSGGGLDEERPTNTGSGSQEDEEEMDRDGDRSPGSEDCHVISNDKAPQFILATVVEETAVVANLSAAATSSTPAVAAQKVPANGNNDSGFADDQAANRANEALNKISEVNVASTAATVSASEVSPGSPGVRDSKKERKVAGSGSRFTIYKVNKASRKKREKSSAKKERKATKTLAIVLGVFLICWAPFFTCNILDAVCSKMDADCAPGVTAFLLTTWLGYMNSFVNPVIYTIFNPEFRKAFKKLMNLNT